jgi:hypothetical protein
MSERIVVSGQPQPHSTSGKSGVAKCSDGFLNPPRRALSGACLLPASPHEAKHGHAKEAK